MINQLLSTCLTFLDRVMLALLFFFFVVANDANQLVWKWNWFLSHTIFIKKTNIMAKLSLSLFVIRIYRIQDHNYFLSSRIQKGTEESDGNNSVMLLIFTGLSRVWKYDCWTYFWLFCIFHPIFFWTQDKYLNID